MIEADEALFEEAARRALRWREAPDAVAREAWLAGRPERRRALAEAEQVLGLVTAAESTAVSGQAVGVRRVQAGRRRVRRIGRVWAPAAAAACLVLGLTATLVGQQLVRQDPHRLVTSVGQVRRFALADGSMVTLNTGSVLQVRYGSSGRKVRLVRGEAFFDVVHDPSRPFVVDSRAGTARVLGTAFDVRLQGREAEVSVLRGAVRVEPAIGGGAEVRAGYAARLDAGPPQVLPLEDASTVDAWRQGRLVVYRRPLKDVVDEIDRYRSGRIIVRGQALGRNSVSGVFDVSRPDAALEALAASLDLRVFRLGRFVVLY